MKKVKLIVVSLLLSGMATGQDSHLSQYYASPLWLNPAMTGMFDDNYRAHLQYRTQWSSVLENPYTTAHVSYDQPWKKFGFGTTITNNRAGAGNFNVFNFLLSGAYEVSIDPQNIHHLTTGVQLGFIQKSVDVPNLLFDNQYTTANGGGFDPNISSGENFEKTNFIVPDVNFGIYYYYVNKTSRFNPYFSVSGFHLTQPRETFFGEENKMPARYVAYWGTKIKINEEFSAEPSFLVMRQANNNEVQFGALAYYFLKESNAWFFLGPYYRNKDAIVIHTGIVYREYKLGMSYDINISSLSTLSGNRGGFEISITYTKQKGKYVPSI